MSDSEPRSLDLFGIKPIADAANAVTKAAVEGASAFLSRICLPACEEFGLLLRDKVSRWRAVNALAIAAKAEQILEREEHTGEVHAHPRLVGKILEEGAWSDDTEVQDLWAGLLAASCDAEGKDDSNMMFVDLLSRMTASQVRLMDYACAHATKVVASAGWLTAEQLRVPLETVRTVSGVADDQRLDRELDHLRVLGLLDLLSGGFTLDATTAGLTPSALALHMYARCHGHKGNPADYYGVSAPPPPQSPQATTVPPVVS
jgi:hypothetical protein